MIVVVLIIALITGAITVSLGAGDASARQRRAMEDVASMLGLARAEAMQISEVRVVEIGAEEGRVWLRYDERDRAWDDAGLRIAGRARTLAELDPRAPEIGRLEVSFDGLGRTTDRVIVMDGRDEDAGRLWVLSFDPVSGAVSVAPADEG